MSTDFAPAIPKIPQEAIDFAKAVGELAVKYEIRDATIELRMDTLHGSRLKGSKIQETMKFHISKRDGRGRPRLKLSVSADMHISADVINEPDSID